jgi:hypothetical protein
VPIIGIILVQVAFINIFLYVSETIDLLDQNAVNILNTNAQNRGEELERLMVHYWSNLDRLEYEVIEHIRDYLEENEIEIHELLGDRDHEMGLLYNVSSSLIDSLRVTASTGVFFYFLPGTGLEHRVHHLNGLYYRNLNPLTQIHANLILVRGHVDFARKENIPLDSLWYEAFTFDPMHRHIWDSFALPQIAAENSQGLSSMDLSFWSGPHHLNPESPVDASEMITYTRPVFFFV